MNEELRLWLLVVEHGTFTAAARHGHISQPALSAAVQRLEHDVGARLLERGRRGASLTSAGHAFLPHARAVLTSLEDGRRAVAELLGLRAGEVRIGASGTAATYLLPPLLGRFRRDYPGVRILLRELMPSAVEEQLESGELDLGVVSEAEGEAFRQDEFILVGASAAASAADPFITFSLGTSTRSALDTHFPHVEIVMELGSIAAVKRHVREGIGVALISRAAVANDLGSGRLVEIPHPLTPITRQLRLVHRGVERLPPAAQALRELLLGCAGGTA